MIKKLSLAVALLINISGCASPPKGAVVAHNISTDLTSIRSAKSETLEKIKTGMPFSEFHELVPEAYLTAQHNEVSAYELAYEQKYVNRGDIAAKNLSFGLINQPARTHKQVLWFYFFQDHLVKWGYPETWPSKSDIEANNPAATSSEK